MGRDERSIGQEWDELETPESPPGEQRGAGLALRLGGKGAGDQTLRTFEACSPLGPSTTSNSTLSPSDSDRKPSAMMAV